VSGIPGRIVKVRGGGSGVGVDTGRDGSSDDDGGGVVLGAPVEVGARFGDDGAAPRAGLVVLLANGASVTATGIGLSVGKGSGLAVGLGLGLEVAMRSLLFDDEEEQANCSSNRLATIELTISGGKRREFMLFSSQNAGIW
jgi:hypothetical protein